MRSLGIIALGGMWALFGVAHTTWAGSYVDHCTCDKVDMYSSARTMGIGADWKFELECNNHGGHGWCSTNVDSAHGAGCGAMTGTLKLYTATQMRTNECSDDHRTCFRGPSYCDNGGSWGVTCRCDTLHSTGPQYGAFSSALSLTDGLDVLQNILYNPVYGKATFGNKVVSAPGTCFPSTNQVWWNNSIKEHDPVCCDDSMGVVVNSVRPAGANWTVAGSYAQTTFYDDGNPGTWSVSADVHGFNCRTVSAWCGGVGESITWWPQEGIQEYCCPGLTPVFVSLHTYQCTQGASLAHEGAGKRAERAGASPRTPGHPQPQRGLAWTEPCRADPECLAWQERQRAALVASIPLRRARLEAIRQDHEKQEAIQARIAQHATALQVEVPTHELFEMLGREYELAIELDDCSAKDDRSLRCEKIRADLAVLRGEFEERTRYTMSEFRQGQREPTDEEMLKMQQMAERQGGRLYFARDKAVGEVAPRLLTEEEARRLQADAESRRAGSRED